MWINWIKFKYLIQTQLVSCEILIIISIAFVILKTLHINPSYTFSYYNSQIMHAGRSADMLIKYL